MKLRSRVLLAGLTGALVSLGARSGTPAAPAAAPSTTTFRLTDQHNRPQEFGFPRQKLTLLTIADKQGADAVDQWIGNLKERYCGRVDFVGVACVGSVPGVFRSAVREGFQKRYNHPVLLDWEGKLSRAYAFTPRTANLIVLDRTGTILHRVAGPATEPSVQAVCAVLDCALEAGSR